jgi:predicted DsbA family dithiol-disulfide isomerase
VGQQRLHKAIQQFGVDKVDVEWKPFMIDPGTNVKGERVDAYCRRRWGGAGWTNHLKSEGQQDGANFMNWQWWPHTLKAHQLVQYCASKSNNNNSISISTDKVNKLLFRAEYEEGENISNVNTLVEIGKKLGVEAPEDLASYLSNDEGEIKVKEDIAIGRQRYKIKGVPFFIIETESSPRPHAFSGAQKSETFLDLFEELAEDLDSFDELAEE